MSQSQVTKKHAELSVENVGGIDTTEIALSPGVTSLTGRNATNRTSLLQALMATLGSDHVSLKGDADHGEVSLTLDGETYTRTLERRDGTVVFDGDPYLEDTEAAELFAFLLESNEARQAVSTGRMMTSRRSSSRATAWRASLDSSRNPNSSAASVSSR